MVDELKFWLFIRRLKCFLRENHPMRERMQVSQARLWMKDLVPGREWKFSSGLGLSLQFVSKSSHPLNSYLQNRSMTWRTTFTRDSVPISLPQQHCYCCPERAVKSILPLQSSAREALAFPKLRGSTTVEGGWNLMGAIISGEHSHNPMKGDWEEERKIRGRY